MSRKTDRRATWKIRGVSVGFVRNGTHWIDRTVKGRRYRLSTSCTTVDGALAELRKFEEDPEAYSKRARQGSAKWDDACDRFLAHSENGERNCRTHVDHQTYYLERFGQFRNGGRLAFATLDSFTPSDIRAFMQALAKGEITGKQLSRRTANKFLAGLKAMMRWARSERLTANTADQEVKLLRDKGAKRLPKDVEPDRWRAVLDRLWLPPGTEFPFRPSGLPPYQASRLCPGPGPCDRQVYWKGYCSGHAKQLQAGQPLATLRRHTLPAVSPLDSGERWRCAAVVQLGAGLRYGEVARLGAGDILPNGLLVAERKGGQGTLIDDVSQATLAAARRLVELGGVPDDNGVEMCRRLESAARRANVMPFTSHQLRHTYATTYLRNGGDLRKLQRNMGHANITTTEIYLHVARVTSAEAPRVFAPL